MHKALALHMLGRTLELKKTLRDLDAPGSHAHHKAAALAIRGDLKGAIHLLQQAIVLGRYSVAQACKDVSFRVFWGVPLFERALSSLTSDQKMEYPFKDSCPMSGAEKAIHSKLSKK